MGGRAKGPFFRRGRVPTRDKANANVPRMLIRNGGVYTPRLVPDALRAEIIAIANRLNGPGQTLNGLLQTIVNAQFTTGKPGRTTVLNVLTDPNTKLSCPLPQKGKPGRQRKNP